MNVHGPRTGHLQQSRAAMRRGLAVLVCIATAIAGGGCGDEDADEPKAPPKPKLIKLTVTTEQFAEFKDDLARVSGTVTPADAVVEVEGVTATVTSGRWTSRARLDELGENTIEVTASKPGYRNASASTVLVRKRSKAQLARVRARKARQRQRARLAAQEREQQEQQQRQAAAVASQVTIPSLVGERLDVARDELRGAGLRAKILGGGTFGVVVESNWTVCETRPGGGGQAKKGDRITLVVDREC